MQEDRAVGSNVGRNVQTAAVIKVNGAKQIDDFLFGQPDPTFKVGVGNGADTKLFRYGEIFVETDIASFARNLYYISVRIFSNSE